MTPFKRDVRRERLRNFKNGGTNRTFNMPYFLNDKKPGDDLYEICYMKRNREGDYEDFTVQVYAPSVSEALRLAKRNGARYYQCSKKSA